MQTEIWRPLPPVAHHGADVDDDEYARTSDRMKCLYSAPFCDFTILPSAFLRLWLAAPESYFKPLKALETI